MAREWQKVKKYKPEQIGTDNLVSQSAEGHFEKNTLVEGVLVQTYDAGDGPVTYVSEGRFVDGKLSEGKKMRGKVLVQESKIDLSRRSVVTSFDRTGRPSKRVFVSKTGDWIKTEVFENGRIVLLREPNALLNLTTFRQYTPENGRFFAVGYMLFDREVPYPNIFKLKELPQDLQSVTLRDTRRALVYQGDVTGFTPHGKGKLYNRHSEVLYSGDLSHGLRHGKGTAYGPAEGERTVRVYSGDFSEDKRHGQGTQYDPSDGEGKYKQYEGSWEHGFLTEGTEYLKDTVLYQGPFHGRAVDGHYFHHGKGERFHENGAPYFKGNFAYGMFTGDNLEVFNADGTKYYEGDLVDGLFGRYGVAYLPDGTTLEQRSSFDSLEDAPLTEITHYNRDGGISYKGGADLITDGATDGLEHITDYKRQREGVIYYENGERFEGEFKDNQRHGPGTYYYADDSIKFQGSFFMDQYDGDCLENLPDGTPLFRGFFEKGNCIRGEGTFQFEDEEYIGLIENGQRIGRGEVKYANGVIRYRGGFENNLFCHDGEEFYQNGNLRYSGSFGEGLYDGSGLLYSEHGDLIYDGHWSAGSRTGEGTMYFSDGSYYEGSFLRDKKDGFGLDFYPSGKQRYEGEFKADKEHGQGKLFSHDGTLIYEGQWQDGRYHGAGKLYYSDGTLHYSGEFLEGKQHGDGSEYDEKGQLRFEGHWEEDERSGQGRVYYKNKESFYGTIADGLKQGLGKYYYADGQLAYEGNYLDNKRHGQGSAYNEDGRLHFCGEWKKGFKDGHGLQYNANGVLIYDGGYQEGKFHGNGKYYTGEGTLYYDGSFQYGKRNGYGLHYNKQGLCDYVGYYEDGMRSGFGISYTPNGEHVMYSGFWSLGKYHGCGVIYLHDEPRFSGMFLNGLMNGRINEIENGRIVREAIYENGQTLYQRAYDYADVLIYEGGACHNGLPDGDGISYDGLGNITFKGRFFQGHPVELGPFLRKTVEPMPEIPELGTHDFNLYRTKSIYKIMGVELETGVRLFCTLENGIPTGTGSAVFHDGRKYFGSFQEGRPSGYGTITGPDGRKYVGEVFDGSPHGGGTLTMPDGNRYEGSFKSMLRNGNLRVLCATGEILHVQYRDDIQVSHAIQYKFIEQSLSRFPDSVLNQNTAAENAVPAEPVPAPAPVPLEASPSAEQSGAPLQAEKAPEGQPVSFELPDDKNTQHQAYRQAADNFHDYSAEIDLNAIKNAEQGGFTVNIGNVSARAPLPDVPEPAADQDDPTLRQAQDVLAGWMETN